MPFEVAQDFIELLLANDKNTQQYLDTRACDGIIIEFIGGEPLLEVELMDKIMDYFLKRMIETNHPWQYNWRISISSNGTLYFNPEVQKFINKWRDHLSYSVSIDGNKQLHDSCRLFPDGTGSYDKAIAAVRHYVDVLHGSMGSKMTLAPANIMYTCDAVKGLIDQGYKEIFLNCVFEKGWEEKDATILYHQLVELSDYILSNNLEDELYISMFEENFFHPKDRSDSQNWCGGNGAMISVDWKGDIYPCIRYMESSLGPDIEPVKIGNVKTGIMTDAKCRNCIQKLKSVNRLNQSTEECIECPIAEGCAWCQAYNYQDSGDFNHRATYICVMHKARALANCYFWNLRYWKNNENKRMKLWLSDEEALKIINEEELEFLKILQYPIVQ
jgi:radical SAM peptide maturase (CXXX-repeat target family)